MDWASIDVGRGDEAADETDEYEPVADTAPSGTGGGSPDGGSRPVCQRCARHRLVSEEEAWVCPGCGVTLPRATE